MGVFIAIAVVAVVFFVFIFFSEKAVIKRKLKKATYLKIKDFKDGQIAKIVGNVILTETPLISPLSRTKCSFYHTLVEQNVSSGKSSKWETIIEEVIYSNFLIQNDNHYAYFNETLIKHYIVQDKSYTSGFLNNTTVNLEEYLNKHGYESEGLFGMNKSLRYNEGVLEINEEIAILGKGIWKDATELDLPKKYGRVLEITATNEGFIYISDHPSTIKKTTRKAKKRYNTKVKRYNK